MRCSKIYIEIEWREREREQKDNEQKGSYYSLTRSAINGARRLRTSKSTIIATFFPTLNKNYDGPSRAPRLFYAAYFAPNNIMLANVPTQPVTFIPGFIVTIPVIDFTIWQKQKCRHSSVDSTATSILPPRVGVPSIPSMLVSFLLYFSLHCKKNENKQKRGRAWFLICFS